MINTYFYLWKSVFRTSIGETGENIGKGESGENSHSYRPTHMTHRDSGVDYRSIWTFSDTLKLRMFSIEL